MNTPNEAFVDSLLICKARSKRSGNQCKNFVTKGKLVCRFHGGKSTGAVSLKGKLKQKKASWKHGLRSKETLAEIYEFNKSIRRYKEVLKEIRIS